MSSREPEPLPTTNPFGPFTLLALVIAAAGAVGTVWLSLVMGLIACPLCFYQRAFMFGALGVLLIGLFTGMGRTASLSVLALSLAGAGLGVASFHVWLEVSGKLECPAGIGGVGTAPQQSLAVFALLTFVLLLDAQTSSMTGSGWRNGVAALVLGGVFAVACVQTAPPLPKPPTEPYKDELKICRPPYVERIAE